MTLAGLRPGEKLFEEKLMAEEGLKKTKNKLIHIGWGMDPAALEKAFEMYPEVKLVVYAELYGFPGNIKQIKEICEKHGALLVEDAAEAKADRKSIKNCPFYCVKSSAVYQCKSTSRKEADGFFRFVCLSGICA